MSTTEKPVFRDLSAEDPDPEVTEVESMCMNCHKNGMTRLLLTRIPYYKNVVIMSFSCEECGFENNEIQPGGAYADTGIRWELEVSEPEDLNRQVVKSDYTRVLIPSLQFEIPAMSQKGEITTVEGIVSRAVAGLEQDQPRRREEHPEAADQIDSVLAGLRRLGALEETWTLTLEDISGNSFIENPAAPGKDPRCRRLDFKRSKQEEHTLGIFSPDEVSEERTPTPDPSILTPLDPEHNSYEQIASGEVLQFRTNCPECNAPADTNMKVTDIPYFKQVVIMATICEACGHRTNEVKSGGGIEEQGVRFEVTVRRKEDFSRDILKSETCSMEIPELELEVGGRALGGRFTTTEGLLQATREQLAAAPGLVGDSPLVNKDSVTKVVAGIDEALSCARAVTIVLDDPAGNSYVQSLSDDASKPDDDLKIIRYERSFEQNEELGLNDIKTEGYEETS